MEKYITMGVAGHVDHGKTSLVRCLTGIDTDRMKEEKKRGVSIESGIAPWLALKDFSIALVDVPGHTDFLRNTVRGLSCVDMAMLVVAADDGVMPQTREHLEILKLFKIKGGFVVLSKADLVDSETLELAELEIRELISGSFLEGKDVIPFSALDSRGLNRILESAQKEAALFESRNNDAPFRLWIDRTTQISGFGTVVSGTMLSGSLKRDDPVQIMPSGLKTRVRFLESHGHRIEKAWAGQRIGINLHKTTMADAGRGMVLRQSGTGINTYLINTEMTVLSKAGTPMKNRMRVKLYIGTLVMKALAVVIGKDRIDPEDSGLVQFRFAGPASIDPGDGFAVSLMNRNRIIGGGVILEIPSEKYTHARATKMIPGLEALRNNDATAFVESVLGQSVNRPVFAADLAFRSGFSLERINSEFHRKLSDGTAMKIGEGGIYLRAYFPDLVERVYQAAEKTIAQGTLKCQVNSGEIRDGLGSPLSDDLLQEAVNELCSTGRLVMIHGGFIIPGHSITLSAEEDRLSAHLLDFAEESGFVPFSARRFCEESIERWNEDKVRKMLHFLHNQNRLIRLTNKRFISCNSMERIKKRVENHIGSHGHVCLSDSQDIMGYGRTMAVSVFEYLDSIGFTRRTGDVRVMKTEEETTM